MRYRLFQNAFTHKTKIWRIHSFCWAFTTLLFVSACSQPKAEWLLASTGPGQTQSLQLSDGTKVTLNENSELRYPSIFTDTIRQVAFKGQAFFEVSFVKKKNFVIKTHSCDVSSPGTKFSVFDTPEQYFLEVVVVEGRATIHPFGKKDFLVLEQKDKGYYQKEWHKLTRKSNDSMNSLAWYTKKLTFDNSSFGDVVKDVQAYYNAHIYVDKGDLLKCPFTHTFEKQDLPSVLKVITATFGLSMESYPNQTYRLRGGECK